MKLKEQHIDYSMILIWNVVWKSHVLGGWSLAGRALPVVLATSARKRHVPGVVCLGTSWPLSIIPRHSPTHRDALHRTCPRLHGMNSLLPWTKINQSSLQLFVPDFIIVTHRLCRLSEYNKHTTGTGNISYNQVNEIIYERK